jgi:Zn-dependent protease
VESIILKLPVLFFSVVVHEFSHGWAAWRRGDDTALRAGRLTLNPLAHVDPFGTVLLPMLCFFLNAPMFGWAKPVPVHAGRLKNPYSDMVRVSLAGPAANLGLALAAALLFKAATLASVLPADLRSTLRETLLFAVTLNLLLAVFNLLPVHPLDGSKILGGLLPRRWRETYFRHVPYGAIILVLLISSRSFGYVLSAPARWIMSAFTRVGLLG